VAREQAEFWYRFAAAILRPLLTVLTKRDWRGSERIPLEGGVIVCPNHISYFDPLTFAHFVNDRGRAIRFLAKEGLFRIPVIGHIIRGAGQIPVYRGGRDAALAFRGAVAAIRRGECVAIYPEGTVTRDPGLWPMVGKTGAARVALATGAPLIPVAQWGPQEVLAPYAKRFRFFPRKTMHILAGPPVDLSEFADHDLTPELLRAATEKIMAAIAELLAELRGEQPPAVRFDMRTHAIPETGNPNKPRTRTRKPDSGERRSA
jgi:1-acyl-sn-glycerol-3-phosphate acyltransferase